MSIEESQETLKRMIDLLVSLIVLILFLPLLIVIALWIKSDSVGPVFFKGERMGRYGRPFHIWKFRTMDQGAGKMEAGLTAADDQRITHAGQYLRRMKLDELPQLINVLRGDMSLVGPRPEIKKYVDMFPDDFNRILQVKPGITDLASIKFRSESELLARYENPEDEYVKSILPEKIRLAHEYIAGRTLTKDLLIILKTLFSIFRNSSAAADGT
ncbi:MAG: sugar transferase [Actinobacteria bacterium]|nr:sugar transferase [Actinomycetota bacterium]